MPKYDNQGQVIQYTIDEVDVAHYAKTIAYDEDTKSYQITNKHKVEKLRYQLKKYGMIITIMMVNVQNKLLFIYMLRVKILERH